MATINDFNDYFRSRLALQEERENQQVRKIGKATPFNSISSMRRTAAIARTAPSEHVHDPYLRSKGVVGAEVYEEPNLTDESKIVTDIVRIICTIYSGVAILSQLIEAVGKSKVREYFGDSRPEVFFSRHHQIFQLERIGGSDFKVKVTSKLRLCDDYRTKDGCRNSDCIDIHICKLFVLGTCRYGSRDTSSPTMGTKADGLCRLSHAFQCDKHNNHVLRENGLDNFESDVLKIIIKQSCPDSFKPEICRYYNTPSGCQKKSHCLNLHICRDYITARCKYGQKCKFSHRVFDPQPKGVLQKYGIDTTRPPREVIHMLKNGTFEQDERPATREAAEPGAKMNRVPSNSNLPAARPASPSPIKAKPTGVVKPNDEAAEPGCNVAPTQTIICIHHISGRCSYGNRCVKHHFDKPFMWQKLGSDGKWVNFDDKRNDIYEQQYCDVNVEKCDGFKAGVKNKVIDFEQMVDINLQVGKVSKLRRLTTITSVKARQHEKLATEWLWYWKDESQQWHQYGDQGGLGQTAGITSTDIELSYQDFIEKGTSNSMQFSAGGQNYTLYFAYMYQQNNQYKTKRDVRRRPKYRSESEIAALLRHMSQGLSAKVAGRASGIPGIGTGSIPKNWDKSAKDLGGFRLVSLAENGDTAGEYRQVAQKFQETMPHDLIVSVERVQNIELWKFLVRRQEAMKRWRTDKKVEVRHLFHGTSEKLLDVICRQNFDWRLCGSSTGTAYGKGSYFATSAKYSDAYTQTNNLYRKVFLARVIVGDYTQGRPDFVRPPAKDADDPFGQMYDSCVNNVSNPSIFVIFESSQVYPEYIITYMRHQELDNLMR
ncbi:protein mono-ADP-ribosyltransferase PARP12-like [Ptychodera flava]|uniref:protein mono-ADP-ribosyltransferase PARP12-like n=1 Tax=Ptychodera flava TaxID=63121 RepID=UPI00396A9A52